MELKKTRIKNLQEKSPPQTIFQISAITDNNSHNDDIMHATSYTTIVYSGDIYVIIVTVHVY